MGGLTQAQINAKKTAINGHLDQRGCQSWNNAFGFNNKPGNYVPTLVIDQNTGAHGAGGRAAQQLPAAGRAGVRPGDQPERHALRRRRPGHRGLGHDRRHPAGQRARAHDARQRRHPVRAEGAAVGRDHGRGVRDAEREDRRLRRRRATARAARTVADAQALAIAYRAGIVSSGANLGKLPIIDSRGYDEQGIHYIWRIVLRACAHRRAPTAATTTTR